LVNFDFSMANRRRLRADRRRPRADRGRSRADQDLWRADQDLWRADQDLWRAEWSLSPQNLAPRLPQAEGEDDLLIQGLAFLDWALMSNT